MTAQSGENHDDNCDDENEGDKDVHMEYMDDDNDHNGNYMNDDKDENGDHMDAIDDDNNSYNGYCIYTFFTVDW